MEDGSGADGLLSACERPAQAVALGGGVGELGCDRLQAELFDVAGVDAADQRRDEGVDELVPVALP